MNGLLLTWLFVFAAQAEPIQSVYLIMVDRYANGDPSNDENADPSDPTAFHGGDIQGIIDHLDDIESLGVQTIWLTPVSKMRTDPIDIHGAFHGYWTDEFGTMEPRFGTKKDLLALKSALHKRKMNLVIDVVLNHVGPDTSLTHQQPDWFHTFGDIKDWDDDQQCRTHDVHGLPDLAHEKQEVADFLIEQSAKWIQEVSPDGFRIDAVRHIDSNFLSRYVSELNDITDPDFAFIGEVYEGNPHKVASETEKTGLTHVFDFPMHFALVDTMCNGGDLRQLATLLTQDRRYKDPHNLVTFLDNHDTPRIQTVCNQPGQVEKAVSLLTTLRGIPSFTWGTSVGLEGQTETEARGDMVFKQTPLRHTIQERLNQRRTIPALHKGGTDILNASKERIAFARVLENQAVVSVMGTTDKPTIPSIAGPATWTPIPSDGMYRWIVTPKTSDGFTAWVKSIAEDQSKTLPVHLRTHADASFIGSDPALGAWNPSDAKGKGTLEAHLPAGGWVAVKTIKQTKSGESIWSPHPNVFIDVNAASKTGAVVDVPHQ